MYSSYFSSRIAFCYIVPHRASLCKTSREHDYIHSESRVNYYRKNTLFSKTSIKTLEREREDSVAES